jgi:hypothetical protein
VPQIRMAQDMRVARMAVPWRPGPVAGQRGDIEIYDDTAALSAAVIESGRLVLHKARDADRSDQRKLCTR